MKILYLFNRIRAGLVEKIAQGEDHDGHFFGMLRLGQRGVVADYLEIEKIWPAWLTRFLRDRFLNIHYVHLPLFLKMRKYDVVFTSTAFGSLFLKTILGLKRPKWVVLDYGVGSLIGSASTLRQKALRFMVSRADGLVTISPGEKEVVSRLFPHLADRIKFLPLGVDTSFFKPEPQCPEEEFVFSPGRDPGRDLALLARATFGLIPLVKVTTRPSRLAELKPPHDHLRCYNFSPVELRQQYQLARLIVLPLNTGNGLNEAMGCSTLVEAMAMGKAIIATQTETMSAYITHGQNGWLVPPGDHIALRTAIVKLMNDESLRQRLGRSARDFVLENCSADIFAHRLAAYFKSI